MSARFVLFTGASEQKPVSNVILFILCIENKINQSCAHSTHTYTFTHTCTHVVCTQLVLSFNIALQFFYFS